MQIRYFVISLAAVLLGFSGSLIVQGRGCLKSIDQYEFC